MPNSLKLRQTSSRYHDKKDHLHRSPQKPGLDYFNFLANLRN